MPLPGEVRESSGVVASRKHSDLLWTHNDSGGESEIFAVDPAGRLLGRASIPGAENKDWEDIALGPCPTGECLYIADTGDNRGSRQDVEIYRIPEPDPNASAAAQAERFRVRYPDGPRDAEALFLLPSGELFVISKESTPGLYRYPLPFRPGETVTLERVRELDMGGGEKVTGADAAADGHWVAVRTNTSLALFRAEDLVTGSELNPLRMDLASLGEVQGEGVSLTADGAVVLTSEGGTRRAPASVARLACTLR